MSSAIAIVGSLDPSRVDELGLRRVEKGEDAAEALGRMLAEHGFTLIVYSSDPSFVEASVVRGYVASGQAQPESIDLRHPPTTECRFPEQDAHRKLFADNPDVSDNWEISYYRSLAEADGVLLVGGGHATLIAGLIALGFAKPLVAVEAFGGNAAAVRAQFAQLPNDATKAHIAAMGRDWGDDSAADLVRALVEQVRAREKRLAQAGVDRLLAERRRRRGLVGAALAFLGAFALMLVVVNSDPGDTATTIALFAAPLLAGVAGALIRTAREGHEDWLLAIVLGLAAGGTSALLFVLSQVLTTPGALTQPGVHTLALFVTAIGFVGGVTFDLVYDRWRAKDVSGTNVLETG